MQNNTYIMATLNSQSYLRLKRAKKRRIKLILYYLSGAAAAAGVLYFLFFSGYFSIRSISVSGADSSLAEEVKKIALKTLDGNRFFISRQNVFLFSTGEIEEVIKKEMPVLETALVEKRFIHQIAIEVKLREKKGIACADKEERTRCFYFDRNGVIFEEAPEIVGMRTLIFRDNAIYDSILPHERYSKEAVAFADDIKNKLLEGAGAGVSYFSFPNDSGDIEARTDKDFTILMNVNSQAEEQARIVKSILENEIKDRVSSLEYIDLRVENRAYYKLRE